MSTKSFSILVLFLVAMVVVIANLDIVQGWFEPLVAMARSRSTTRPTSESPLSKASIGQDSTHDPALDGSQGEPHRADESVEKEIVPSPERPKETVPVEQSGDQVVANATPARRQES